MSDDIIHKIVDANPTRDASQLDRRLMKLTEELGEVFEAYLGVTSDKNYKEKTWHDVREELVDVVLVAVDCLYTPLPIDDDHEKIHAEVVSVLDAKINKWKRLYRGNE